MNISEQAIEAAARELNPRAYSDPADVIGLTMYGETTEDTQKRIRTEARYIASTVLEAALPHIRAQIAAAIQRRKRDLAEGYSDIALAMLEAGMEEAARIAEEGATK